MALRPYWSGTIRLSLVSLPVNMYLAVNRQRTIAFHEIYKPTGERVHHALMAGDKQVDRDDLVKGYEVEKGEYVLIEPEEIKELKIPSSKVLDIAEFVGVDEIDDVYVETPYFIAPDGKGNDTTFRSSVMLCARRRRWRSGNWRSAAANGYAGSDPSAAVWCWRPCAMKRNCARMTRISMTSATESPTARRWNWRRS